MKPTIIAHRGLDPDIKSFPAESSLAAFKDHLDRGYGIEFDVNFSDDDIFVTHHKNASAAAPKLSEILDLIRSHPNVPISAIHYKGPFQTTDNTKKLLESIGSDIEDRVIIFDLRLDIARDIKKSRPNISLACSIAHPFDIKRYGNAVSNTLITIDQAIAMKDIFSWAWLDEWDLKDEDGANKELYSQKNMARLREHGFLIAVVSPELHATSPGLLGDEYHEDAQDRDTLIARLNKILSRQPDAICTDHPDLVAKLIESSL